MDCIEKAVFCLLVSPRQGSRERRSGGCDDDSLTRPCRAKSPSSTATATASIAKIAGRNTSGVSSPTHPQPLPILAFFTPSLGLTLTHPPSPDFRAVSTYQTSIHDHRTGRRCALCSGPLLDSIVNFTESLPPEAVKLAFQHAKKADLCLVLGSSLTVSPANEVPEVVGNGRRRGATLAICNLQSTPLDGLAGWRARAKTDELMARVMEKLGWEIPGFVLRRRLLVTVTPEGAGTSGSSATGRGARGGGRRQLLVAGLDVDGTPATFLRSVRLVGQRREVKQEPFAFQLRGELAEAMPLRVELEFMGHYGEPGLEVAMEGEEEEWEFALEYYPCTGEWKTNKV